MDQMDEPARSVATRMQTYDSLASCASHAGCVRTLARISTRLSRPVDLSAGIIVLEQHEAAIASAFSSLLPSLQSEARAKAIE